tara:strand:- start:102 stop:683 length:582 start_codon:yes stop_codon:yes gene_type:complete
MKILSFILVLTLLTSASFAKEELSKELKTTESYHEELPTLRLKKRHGLTTGLSELGLSGLSFKYSFQIDEKLRLKLGYSTLAFMGNSKGIGIDYVFEPLKTFSPIIGLNLFQSKVVNGKKFMADLLVRSLTGNEDKIKMTSEVVKGGSINLGLDFRTKSGLIFNVGMNSFILKYDRQFSKIKSLPYLNIGKAF